MNTLMWIKIAIVAGAFFAGWMVNDWRWDAKWSDREKSLSDSHAITVEEYRQREHTLQDAVAWWDAKYTEEMKGANDENSRLRASVDAGSKRLFVRAQCPFIPGLPAPPERPSVDHGSGAELSADARQDYFSLREGLIRLDKKLSACQAVIKAEREEEKK